MPSLSKLVDQYNNTYHHSINNSLSKYDSAAKKIFLLKTEVDKLETNKLVNVPTNLNKFFKKVDNLDLGKLKTVPVDLKKLSDVVDNEVVKNINFNTLKTKVNNLEKKILIQLL